MDALPSKRCTFLNMKVPKNIIQTGKYTIGKDFINKKTHLPYQGYYYEINGKFFAGKEFNNNAPEIVKITSDQVNNLLLQAATFVYGKLSKTNLKDSSKIPSTINNSIEQGTRYFAKHNNVSPILIKEIDKDTFTQYQNNSLYQVISIESPEGKYFSNQKSLDEAEKQMPGIKAFLLSEQPPD